MTRVVVAVPAHDEAAEIADCLGAVRVAASRALSEGVCSAVTIAVSLNRCTDATDVEVQRALGSWRDRLVVEDDTSNTVGGVRGDLVARATGRRRPRTTWVFNTDADSRAPEDWITSTLHQVQGAGAVAAAGMVALRGWSAARAVQDDYRALLERGIDGHVHTHVYGANLAVRLDAYRRVGGFHPVHAEDQDLVDRLRLAGEPVATLLAPVVLTSAREPGRAEGGLGSLLQRLRLARSAEAAPEPSEQSVPRPLR